VDQLGRARGLARVDDDGNGYIDYYGGWDFVQLGRTLRGRRCPWTKTTTRTTTPASPMPLPGIMAPFRAGPWLAG